MKYVSNMPFLSAFAGLSLVLFLTSCEPKRTPSKVQHKQAQREAITFIMGFDADAKNPFYRNAELYYRYNESEKTELVITSCHSLFAVQEYLMEYAPKNQQPWGLINLVSHGNPYLGLSVKISPDGKRATADRIRESIENGRLQRLPEYLIDDDTQLVLHSCGLGNNRNLVDAITSAFSTKEASPKVEASPYFEYYVPDKENKQQVRKFMGGFWFFHYKMGYKPENMVIENKLANKYPDSDVNWKQALMKEEASEVGDLFHYTFEVPVKWVFTYDCKEDVPQLDTKSSILQWAKEHPKIGKDLQKLDIPPEKFNWWLRNIYVKNEDGSKTPALWVKAYCTTLCVIKLLPDNNKGENKFHG